MKLAVVVQRYGAEVSGGAELHARYVAERMARHATVQVITTCARDYLTWRNEFPEGIEETGPVTVERFPVANERNLVDFGTRSARVFDQHHSLEDELSWLDSQGPVSPGLLARVRKLSAEVDFVLFFSARYYHAYHGTRQATRNSVLVPTAEREPSIGLGLFGPMFRGVRGIMYNSPEERRLIHGVSHNEAVPGVTVGIGSDIPHDVQPARARQTLGLPERFLIYVGRIDANKGCRDLFDHYINYVERAANPVDLVLVGLPVLPIPTHPRIRHLGQLGDRDKFDAIAAAELLVMPSPFESLSMVALEAWALGRPVLANAKCDVLVGQCLRSNAGLYYDGPHEFRAVVERITTTPGLASALGSNGRTFYRANYDWTVIDAKYLDMFGRLKASSPGQTMEPRPWWFARRRRNLPPARAVVDAQPSGPATSRTEEARARPIAAGVPA